MKTIHVAAAVILHDDKIFATQKGYGDYEGWWEFPGGKIEAGETSKEALIREIKEELDCRIEIVKLLKTIEFDYPKFHLVMDCFLCRLKDDKPKLLEAKDAKWLSKEQLFSVKWLKADYLVLDEIEKYL